jgi:biopolymer transport protein ExbD
MRIKTQFQTEAPPNLMPLIDMVFLLLIFFLVATTFHQEELDIKAQLPGASRAIKPMSAPPPQFIVNILHDGTITVSGTPKTRKQVAEMLTHIARNDPTRNVLVRADKRSIHAHFAWVVAQARQRGIAEVNIGYIVEDPKRVLDHISTKGQASGT